ncbi:MAG: BPL-N domain-containing protein [Bacteroidales bacterium]|nr:BPL-N domain-containing protein [Bacteroidales bacterium]
MKHTLRLASLAALLIASVSVSAQPNAKGYYKDIFMDSGIKLTSRVDLPAARFLNLQMERFISVEDKGDTTFTTIIDTLKQRDIMCGSAIDENGVLLYPDGQPRFRMIYMNGGRANSHGRALEEKGRENIRTFVKNGGSYVGTCAGMFIASKGTRSLSDTIPPKDYEFYTAIWPAYCLSSGLSRTPTGMFVVPDSPLLKYYDYGGDMYIDSVYHNGGGYTIEAELAKTPGAEILLRYDYPKKKMHNNVSAWAWKENEQTGRIVICGSHPEGVTSGERLHLFSAFCKYAMEGNGNPVLKGELKLGEAREMTKSTRDNDPAYTKIGDKQYHHFCVEVPEGRDTLTVKLASVKGWDNYDLYLFADYQGFAFSDEAPYEDLTLGVAKELKIAAPKAGKLYISVFCNTTVTAVDTPYGEQYTGRVDVLNGVPYIISVE